MSDDVKMDVEMERISFEVSKLLINPGDVVVVKVNEYLNEETFQILSNGVKTVLEKAGVFGVGFVVAEGDVNITTIAGDTELARKLWSVYNKGCVGCPLVEGLPNDRSVMIGEPH